MATKKTETLRTYTVSARIVAEIGLEIQAPSWEEALVKAKTLKQKDFIDPNGDVNDWELPEIRSIWVTD